MIPTPIDTPQAKPENYVDSRDLNDLLKYVLSRLEESRLIPRLRGILPPHHKPSPIYRLETVVEVASHLGYQEGIRSSYQVRGLEGKDLDYEVTNLAYLVEIVRSEDKNQPNNLAEHADLKVDDRNTYERYAERVGKRLLPEVVAIIREEVKRRNGRCSTDNVFHVVKSRFSIPYNKVYSLASEIIATYKRIEKEIENITQAHQEVEAATS